MDIRFLFPDLNSGITLAILNSSGKVPVSIHELKRYVGIGQNELQSALRSLGDMSLDLLLSRLLIISWVSLSVIGERNNELLTELRRCCLKSGASNLLYLSMFRFLATFTKYSFNLVHISRRFVTITPFISIKLGSLLFLLLHRMELITEQAFLIFPLALLNLLLK